MLIFSFASGVCADTVYLKSGKAVEGVVIEENDEFIKVDTGNAIVIKYYRDEVARIVKPDNPEFMAQGVIHGMNFICDHAEYDSKKQILSLRQGEGVFLNLGVSIFLVLGEGVLPENQVFDIKETSRQETMPRIQLQWLFAGKNIPQMQSVSNGYIMKLDFEKRTENLLAGRIHLKLPDNYQTEIEGKFEAVIK